MPKYEELVKKYKKRRHDTLVDSVTTGLSYADNVAADLGLLEDTGVLGEVLESAGNVLPFAVIAITEECKVIMGRKSQKAAAADTVFRMVKTGAAMGVGAAAAIAAGPILAIPAAIGARTLLDKYKSRNMTGLRVAQRTARLKTLSESIRSRQFAPVEDVKVLEGDVSLLPCEELQQESKEPEKQP